MPTGRWPDRTLAGFSLPLAVSGLYAFIGGLYVALSDHAVEALIVDPDLLTDVQTFKGWAFILLTAAMLYFVLRRHERNRLAAVEALRDSEQRYRRIVETTNEGVCIVDADCVAKFVNDTMVAMLGVTREQLIGRHFGDFIDEAWRGVAKRMFHKRRLGERAQYECGFLRPDGGRLWAIVASTPMLDESGRFVGAVKMLTDISQRKADEQELKASYESQKQLLNELDHRVRNNLASLKGLLDLTKSASRDVDTLVSSLGGRLDAMSRAHALLSSARWTPPQFLALLEALIPGQVRPHYKLEGPSILVPPPQVGPLAIVLHELISNSIRHGSLAPVNAAGAVSVTWSTAAVDAPNGETGDTALTIQWQERGGKPIEEVPSPGSGTSLLRGLVRFDLQGTADLTYPRTGAFHTLRLRLRAPPPAEAAGEALRREPPVMAAEL